MLVKAALCHPGGLHNIGDRDRPNPVLPKQAGSRIENAHPI
jgi:hypothetical protein